MRTVLYSFAKSCTPSSSRPRFNTYIYVYIIGTYEVHKDQSTAIKTKTRQIEKTLDGPIKLMYFFL